MRSLGDFHKNIWGKPSLGDFQELLMLIEGTSLEVQDMNSQNCIILFWNFLYWVVELSSPWFHLWGNKSLIFAKVVTFCHLQVLELTKHPHLPRTPLVLALKIPHPKKSCSHRQTNVDGHSTCDQSILTNLFSFWIFWNDLSSAS